MIDRLLQALPFSGQPYAGRMAHKQRFAEPTLKLANLMAHRTVGHVQFLCRTRNALLTSCRIESTKRIKRG
ncbi:hypothetical protein PBS_54330 [Paraburkholderia sp. 2C]